MCLSWWSMPKYTFQKSVKMNIERGKNIESATGNPIEWTRERERETVCFDMWHRFFQWIQFACKPNDARTCLGHQHSNVFLKIVIVCKHIYCEIESVCEWHSSSIGPILHWNAPECAIIFIRRTLWVSQSMHIPTEKKKNSWTFFARQNPSFDENMCHNF